MIKFIIAVCLFSASTRTTAAGLLGLSKIYKAYVALCNLRALHSCNKITPSNSVKTAPLCGLFFGPGYAGLPGATWFKKSAPTPCFNFQYK